MNVCVCSEPELYQQKNCSITLRDGPPAFTVLPYNIEIEHELGTRTPYK